MSTGKRLAKRSIIGTRVCAPGEDGKYYSGVIHAVKTPASAASESGLSITPRTRYSVRFDSIPGGRPPSPSTEYSDRDLIGPGFGSVTTARLVSGQKVYLTYNGREIHAEVTQHREHLDEVDVTIVPNGHESTMNLTKRIDEIRLLESRKSARLADQDTDFARLADMAGDRKRTSSHSIDVPHVIGSRKRRPSSSNDSERPYSGGWGDRICHNCGREGCRGERGDCMDECTAALVLMSLSCSPHSPHNTLPLQYQYNYGSWTGRGGATSSSAVVGSPGVGTSNSSSSSSGASWRSSTPSPPLSDEGAPTVSPSWPAAAHSSHNQPHYPCNASGSSSGSTPGSTTTLDEGIVPDYFEEQRPRKKRIRARIDQDPIENGPSACATSENETKMIYQCTWPGCLETHSDVKLIEGHVRQSHLGPKKSKEYGEDCDMSDHEEEFYYQEVAVDHISSAPTMSHRDMARPPHEDPEYQKQLRLGVSPAVSNCTENVMTGVKERSNAFSVSQLPNTPVKHIKLSPRSLQAYHQQNLSLLAVSTGKMPSSPRRARGESRKCRKIYGMDQRDLWCTQCKWKKACTRFND